MPHTVPSRPTKGAVEPTVASNTWPACSLSKHGMQSIAQQACQVAGIGRPHRPRCPAGLPGGLHQWVTRTSRSNACTDRANPLPMKGLAKRRPCCAPHRLGTLQQPGFPQNHNPAAHRHDQQYHCHAPLTASPCRSRSSAFTANPTRRTCQTSRFGARQENARRASCLGRR
jgi:hypothetical protein